MKIKQIKINGFGKLQNKEIELSDGINIINGKNESGKSTLLKFITGMLYGLARTKNGKEISDYERYKPWNAEEFSGKLSYELDSKESFEIFREFSKKNAKLYDENSEEISSNYILNKAKGSDFFFEQTGITEEMLLKTAISEQQEVALDKNDQNIILQKISNTVSTGEETVSFKKTIEKLNRIQLEQVGTTRSTGRPINIVSEKLEQLEREKQQLIFYKEKSYQLNDEKVKLQQDYLQTEQKIEELEKAKKQLELENIEQEKININKQQLSEIEQQLSNLGEETPIKTRNTLFIILAIILVIITGIIYFVTSNVLFSVPTAVLAVIFIVIAANKHMKVQKQIQLQRTKKEQEQKILQSNKDKIIKNIEEIERTLHKSANTYAGLKFSDIQNMLIKEQELLNQQKIKDASIEIEKRNISQQLERLAIVEEELQVQQEQKSQILSLNNSFVIAKQAFEEAYEEMKQNITPVFVNNLSKTIYAISDGKYEKVKFSDTDGVTVELANGDYIKCERLSIGTIDQMYMALRLSALKEVSTEKMPIILDEAFVYYDNERLQNILKFLAEEFSEHQIIILTCSDREEKMLDKLEFKYKEIGL